MLMRARFVFPPMLTRPNARLMFIVSSPSGLKLSSVDANESSDISPD